MLRNLSLALVLTTAVALPVHAIADEDHGHWYRDHGDYHGYGYRGYPGYGYHEWNEHGPFGEHPYERFHEWQEHGGFGEDDDD